VGGEFLNISARLESLTQGALSGTYFRDILSEALRLSVRNVAEEARNQVLLTLTGRILRVRTGTLRTSWSGYPKVYKGVNGGWIAEIGSSLDPATSGVAIHEFGGIIRPVRAKALAFRLEDGTFIQTQMVVMPERRYISIALDNIRSRVDGLIRAAVVEAVGAVT
jgi:hypothetical protein